MLMLKLESISVYFNCGMCVISEKNPVGLISFKFRCNFIPFIIYDVFSSTYYLLDPYMDFWFQTFISKVVYILNVK